VQSTTVTVQRKLNDRKRKQICL